MTAILLLIGKCIDLTIFPFQTLDPIWGFTAVCIVLGTIAVVIFKYVSNQKKIKDVKSRIKMHFLAIRLYKDDFREILKAQKEILKNNFWYFIYSFQAAIPIICFMLLTISQLTFRYGYSEIQPEQVFDCKVIYAKDADRRPEPQLILSDGLEAVTPAMYLGEENEVSWQLKADKPGRHQITFKVCDQEYIKEIIIGELNSPFSPLLGREGFFAGFINPLETPLPKKSLLESIEIGFKPKYFGCFPFNCQIHWLLLFPIIAIGFGLIVRKILKVD